MTEHSAIIRRFRAICIAEGVSWVILLGGMAVKYGMDRPEAVRWPGMLHGVLFIAYIVTAIPMFTRVKWSPERIYGVVAAGFLPFGTFVLERKWLR
jgi:integral membrane protein